ncbi:MAG: TonB-dependent receptor, partial [Sediminibacterium sp.]|nr:TonB-dependent receptor [Sediminibacterium sp.]
TRVGKFTTGKFTYSNFAKNLAVVPAPFDWANDYDGIDRASTDIAGAVADYTYLENVVNNEFQANLTKDIGKFSNKLLLGYSVYQRKTKSIFVNSTSIVVPEIYNVSNRQGNLDGNEANTLERKFGYYADFSSNFNKYLTLEAVFRYDYTSRFYAPNRDASLYAFPYYGASLAFQLTDAIPSIKSPTLNDIKFKASYNKNGNDNLPLYALDLTYGNATGFPFGSNVGLTVGNVLPNSGLKPEFVTTVEFGTEIALFNNRVNFEAVYYNQSSVDQVITVKVPNSTGFSNLLINVGETQNKGLELDLKVQIIKSKDFNWEVGLRYSKNENKVVALYPGINEFSYGGYAYATSNVIVGQSFPQLKTTGYYYDDAGRRRVDPVSGYPIQNTSLLSRGNVLPTDLVGFSSKLKYKRWSLNWNMEYRGGNVIFSQIGRDMTFTGSGKWTENRAPHIFENSYYIDVATKNNTPNTTVQARESEYELWVSNYRLIAENFVSPAWFIKLREINLVYDFSENFIKKSKVFNAASV